MRKVLFFNVDHVSSYAFCRPSPGLDLFLDRVPGADAPGYYATAPRGSEFGSLRSLHL